MIKASKYFNILLLANWLIVGAGYASEKSHVIAPKQWYLTVDKLLAETINEAMQVPLQEGIYYEDQRQVWYREDIVPGNLIDEVRINLPSIDSYAYIGLARENFFARQELWLVTANRTKFMLAAYDENEYLWQSRQFVGLPHFWLAIENGILTFDPSWKMTVTFHSPSTSKSDLKSDRHAFPFVVDHGEAENVFWPQIFYHSLFNRLLVATKTDDLQQLDLQVIDLDSMKVEKSPFQISSPFNLSNNGVFWVSPKNPGELLFRDINLSSFNKETALWGPINKKLYELRKDDKGQFLDSFLFDQTNFFVVRPNNKKRKLRYIIDSERNFSRYQGEKTRFTPSTINDSELISGFEHKDMLQALKSGSKTPIYGLADVNRFLSDHLGARKDTWTILRYKQGQMPEEIVSSFIWGLDTGSVYAPASLANIDRVWSINADLLFETKDNDLAVDYMRVLREVSEGKNSILFFKDFPTTLDSESGAVIAVVKTFWNTFRFCLQDGQCRVIMTIREPVFQKINQAIPDILSESQQYLVPTLDKKARLNIIEGFVQKLERTKKLKVSDETLNFVFNYANRFGRTKASPQNEIDLFYNLFSFVDSYYPQTHEIGQNIGRAWVDHLRGIDQLRKRIDIEGLRKYLKQRVVSHDNVIDAICDGLKPAVNGTHFDNKPLAFFTLVGTPGVGKTYLAKLIADYLTGKDSLILFDMRTFKGVNQGNPAWQALNSAKNEIRVVAFDDVDQVGKQQLDMLAGIIEEGKLAQGSSEEISFSNTIVLWTANWGEELIRNNDASESNLKLRLRRELTEPLNGKEPIMRRRIWSRIESSLYIMFPFALRQLFELAIVHTRNHIENLKTINGIELKIDPKLLIKTIAFEAEVQGGARSVINRLESSVFNRYQDSLTNPEVTKIVLLQMNDSIEVFTNLDEFFQFAWDQVTEIDETNMDDFLQEFGNPTN